MAVVLCAGSSLVDINIDKNIDKNINKNDIDLNRNKRNKLSSELTNLCCTKSSMKHLKRSNPVILLPDLIQNIPLDKKAKKNKLFASLSVFDPNFEHLFPPSTMHDVITFVLKKRQCRRLWESPDMATAKLIFNPTQFLFHACKFNYILYIIALVLIRSLIDSAYWKKYFSSTEKSITF